MNADPVGDACGVFVGGAAANDTNDGTKGAPLATLGAAITAAAAKGSRVYACAQEFAEPIEVPAGIEVYGGLDCATDWKYVEGQKTTIAPAADLVPVTLLAGEGARLEDVAVVAADATVAGGSSIAVIAQDGATAEMLRCDLRAGAGAAGAPGMTPTEVGPNGEGQNGEPGVTGVDEGMACTTMTASLGGGGGQRTCDRMSVSGGRGGSGTPDDSGGAGSPGQGQPGTPPLDGAGGKAQDAMACGQGNAGAEGTPGLAGSGAAGIGDINAAGYTAMSGSAGMSTGMPGQGGGGGGGAKKCMNNNAGPSGGGGGSGGCGGAPGLGGGAGGSSIGLLSHQATIALTSSSIVTALGGAGGLGGNGQPGGFGGQPGLAGGMGGACPGGIGGSGGRGGSGGGGLGGHSLGIAFKGTAPVQTDVTIVQGAQGLGGLGGDGDLTAQGADGQACKTLSFDEPGSCM